MSERIDAWRVRVAERVPEPARPWLTGAGAVLGLLAGLGWNLLLLGRINRPFTSAKLLVLLGILGILLVLEHRIRAGRLGVALLEERGAPVIAFGALFCLSSLYNAYAAFYLKSASNLKMALFGLTLVGVLAATRLLPERAANAHARLLVYLLCSFSLFLFLVPMATGGFGGATFLLAGVLALGLNAGVLGMSLARPSGLWSPPEEGLRLVHAVSPLALVGHGASWLGALALLGVLHLGELIPPVPVAMVDCGVYREIERTDDGYVLRWEKPPVHRFWRRQDRPFRLRPGDRVHFYTALFAPRDSSLRVVHRWERWQSGEGWQTTDRIGFRVIGGRSSGCRGYTHKGAVEPGHWRVIVKTARGREIGRRRFRIVEGEGMPELRRRIAR